MRRFPERVLSTLLVIALALSALTQVVGCTPEQVDQLIAQRQNVQNLRNATTQGASDLQAEIATLPPDDPVRKAAEKKLGEFQKVLAKVDPYLARLDAAINAAQSGNLNDPGLRDAVRDIPYAPLALAVFSIGYGVWQRLKRDQTKKALTQVVQGWETAVPTKTDDQKLKLAAAQDADTRQLVTAIKGA